MSDMDELKASLRENTRETKAVSDRLDRLERYLRQWIDSDDPSKPGVKLRLDRLESGFGIIKWALGLILAGALSALGAALWSSFRGVKMVGSLMGMFFWGAHR